MGRTYEALTSRTKREHEGAEESSVPPTLFVPIAHAATPLSGATPMTAPAGGAIDEEGPAATADTALADELAKDNTSVPFIEVGGPRGSPPTYGPLLTATPLPASVVPLRLDPMPAPIEASTELRSTASVAFFPLPERRPLDPRAVAAELVAYHRPQDGASAQYRAVLAGLEAQHPGAGCPLLIFTTVGRAVEAATVILNLAITRARDEQKRILVIEANHERPLLASRLGVPALPGLRELLNRSIPMSVALHPTVQSHLYVLPPGDADMPVSHESEARLPDVVDQLRTRFDWLLVNGPEWESGGSAEWAGLGDAAYLVVRHVQWDSPEVEAAHEGISRHGGKLRGYITLNG
jgi:Mrp family chromosome partitioning ATPase